MQLTHRHWLLASTHAVAWRSAHHHNQKPTDGTRDWRMMCSVNDSLHHWEVKKQQRKNAELNSRLTEANVAPFSPMPLLQFLYTKRPLGAAQLGIHTSIICDIQTSILTSCATMCVWSWINATSFEKLKCLGIWMWCKIFLANTNAICWQKPKLS